MKVGIYLPQFRPDSQEALQTARAAESAGIDGVFVLDHLWAPGNRSRVTLPIFPLLHEVADATQAVSIGTLVVKVGVRTDEALLGALRGLHDAGGSRCVFGLGTGDDKSLPEYEAQGLAMAPMGERRRRLSRVVRELTDADAEVWVGGLSEAMKVLATVNHAVLNLWQPPVKRMAEVGESSLRWTWGGVVPSDPGEALPLLRPAVDHGADWLVLAPEGVSDGLERVRFAAACRDQLQA